MEHFWRWNVLELEISGFKPSISGEEICHSQKRMEDGIFLEVVFSGDEGAVAKAGCVPLEECVGSVSQEDQEHPPTCDPCFAQDGPDV